MVNGEVLRLTGYSGLVQHRTPEFGVVGVGVGDVGRTVEVSEGHSFLREPFPKPRVRMISTFIESH